MPATPRRKCSAFAGTLFPMVTELEGLRTLRSSAAAAEADRPGERNSCTTSARSISTCSGVSGRVAAACF